MLGVEAALEVPAAAVIDSTLWPIPEVTAVLVVSETTVTGSPSAPELMAIVVWTVVDPRGFVVVTSLMVVIRPVGTVACPVGISVTTEFG